jgi:hypothetical protein
MVKKVPVFATINGEQMVVGQAFVEVEDGDGVVANFTIDASLMLGKNFPKNLGPFSIGS